MSTATIALPTVISNSVILNAVVRGVEKTVEELGESYFSVVHKDFLRVIVSVYRQSSTRPVDPLDPTQAQIESEPTVWSMELRANDLTSSKIESPFFKANPPQFFFLTRELAEEYIRSVETAVSELVKARAAAKTTEENS